MKRIGLAIAVVVVGLVAAGSALAAVNTYSATYKFKGGKGTKSKPAALSFTQDITVKPATAGSRTGILHTIKTTINGVKVNVKGFPTCSPSKIAGAANYDASCPKKALVATGYINASLGSASDFTAAGQTCNPYLDVWNAGQGKLAFFFVDKGSHQCLGGQLHTGQVAPWTATYKQQGSKLAVNIPIPNSVDYPLGLNGGLVGSLSKEVLNWKSQSMGSKHDIESIGCRGKRAYTFSFKASLPKQSTENKTVSGKAACA